MGGVCKGSTYLVGDKGDRLHYRLDENPWPESGVTPWLSGLPKLPETHSPVSEHWTNSVAICAIMKDENITDVREWLTYYRCALAAGGVSQLSALVSLVSK